MDVYDVSAIVLGGSPLGLASLKSASLKREGELWQVNLVSDWSSDLGEALRAGSYARPVELQLTVGTDMLTGTVSVEVYGDRGREIDVRLAGQGKLRSDIAV